MSKSLAVNAGSSTVKFKLFDMPSEEVLAEGLIERIGLEMGHAKIKYGDGQVHDEETPFKDHGVAVEYLLKQLTNLGIVKEFNEITAVGHRIVAGGEFFKDSAVIDDDVMAKIDALAEYAPLHNPAELIGIKAFKQVLPDAFAIAVFDTSFHTSMPKMNALYSLPYEWYEKYGARKYGAHGTSHRYVASRAAALLGKPLEELNLITCHIGAGASITAIKNGKSYDTSMGFTPLAGITMATRSGDVDPSLVNFMENKLGISSDEMVDILNHKSGLLGLSGISSDMRDVQAAAEEGNEQAQLALDIFENRIVRYIGSYMAELGHTDAIVFTAGVGENDIEFRQAVADQLKSFGLGIDPEKNNVRGEERDISSADATVKSFLIPTDEELMIVRDIERLKQA
ncbi:acetate/propionate family kinase [Limosilactobacillus ingluviei]|uniref:acetate/propionate family kinase n=1 Tax=Limosilactobacillus ingluviei TaxID=148604 RepID=UPI001957B883|nr:acetate kinase [Limosilactobacillus ingluviei]MBM6729267.1 acetate kinase [Limosilactobacillus ingluviei]MDO4604167.1 acetate kinase [Limosilactobacillus ingluviei]HJG49208.1 acetate kinase [Limosilactobacillus ingluviei]